MVSLAVFSKDVGGCYTSYTLSREFPFNSGSGITAAIHNAILGLFLSFHIDCIGAWFRPFVFVEG